MSRTPKANKPAATPASAKQAASSKKQQVEAQQASQKKTPSKKNQKPEEDSEDSDDEEEMAVLASKRRTDPEDEEVEEEDEVSEEESGEEDEDEEDEGEEDEENVYRVIDHLACGHQLGIRVPAGQAIHVLGAGTEYTTYPLHITQACLGPDAEEGDRACLVATMIAPQHDHDHDHDDDEEEHDHDHDHDEAIVEEIVCATLSRDVAENAPLDLMIDGDFIFVNTSKNTDIYVTARLIVGDEFSDDEEDAMYDDEEDEDEDDEDMEASRESIEDSDSDSEEEDPAERKARAMEMRKRLLEESDETKGSKKAKTESGSKPASGKPKNGPTQDDVKAFILDELKSKKSMKTTDLGTIVSKKYNMPFKAMGFEEKSIIKFLETVAKGKVTVAGDIIKYGK